MELHRPLLRRLRPAAVRGATRHAGRRRLRHRRQRAVVEGGAGRGVLDLELQLGRERVARPRVAGRVAGAAADSHLAGADARHGAVPAAGTHRRTRHCLPARSLRRIARARIRVAEILRDVGRADGRTCHRKESRRKQRSVDSNRQQGVTAADRACRIDKLLMLQRDDLPADHAAAFANETPTSNDPTRPGPCVTAMASISFSVRLD